MRSLLFVAENSTMGTRKILVFSLLAILIVTSFYFPLHGQYSGKLANNGNTMFPDSSLSNNYNITFIEHGLPQFPGTGNVALWQVNLTINGSSLVEKSTQTSISYQEANGKYHFKVTIFNGLTVTPSTGNVTVKGADVIVPLDFSSVTHILMFNETGLGINYVPGENSIPQWGVELSSVSTGNINESSQSTGIEFNVPDGTYSYRIIDPNSYYAVPETGTVVISGTAYNVNILFSSTIYRVILNETGLPEIGNGSSWSASLSGNFGTVSDSSLNHLIEFSVPNGTYTYHVNNVPYYVAVPSGGTFLVSGENYNIPVTFVSGMYNLSFNETGLPSSDGGTSWGVKLVNSTSHGYVIKFSQSQSISFVVPNGSYSYSTIIPSNYTAYQFSGAGNVNITQQNEVVKLFFTPNYFILKFEEKNLSGSGGSVTPWAVKVGTTVENTSSPSLEFLLPMNGGPFSYSVLPVNDYAILKNSSGSISSPTQIKNSTGVETSLVNVTFNYSQGSQPVFQESGTVNFPYIMFSESGLPKGAAWSVGMNVSGKNNVVVRSSTSNPILFNDSIMNNFTATKFYFSVYEVSGFIPIVNRSSSILWSGTVDENVSVVFAKENHTIRFTQTGLPQLTQWNVTITFANGTNVVSSAVGVPIYFTLPNGNYQFRINQVGIYRADNNSGTVKISNSSINAYPSFSTVFSSTDFYSNFFEDGLPSGTVWSVDISGSGGTFSTRSSAGEPISFLLPNGTYYYAVHTSSNVLSYSAQTGFGIVTVKGTAVSITTTFVNLTHEVTFLETGLPAGTTWGVDLGGNNSASLGTGNVTFYLPNGTYYYTIPGLSGYTSNETSGNLTVKGTSIFIEIRFTSVLYRLTFDETGVPAGSSWAINLNGNDYLVSGNSTVFSVPNGTYNFMLLSVTGNYVYYPIPAGGYVIVKGTGIVVNISYQDFVYNVSFLEKNLTTGSNWDITFNGITKYSLGSEYINFSGQNGSYTYSVGIYKDYTPHPFSGVVNVTGPHSTIDVNFTLAELYKVEFIQQNLPSGFSWGLTVSGEYNYSSANYTTSIVTMHLPNGTYLYKATSSNTTYKPPLSGFLFVNGPQSYVVYLNFTKITYKVVFTESGLKAGTSWSMELNGATYGPASANNYSFNLSNGSYTYRFYNVTGYHITSSLNGTLVVNGSSRDISVTYAINQTVITRPPPPASPTTKFTLPGYALVVIIAVAVVGAGIGAAVLMQRKKKV